MTVTYTRTAAPTVEPVSLEWARDNLRLTDDIEDLLLAQRIMTAGEMVEEMMGKQLITQTWQRVSPGASDRIEIAKTPVQSISSISYQDQDDATQTLTVSDFYLYASEDRAYLEPKSTAQWPVFYDREDSLTITFVAGFGDAESDVPETAKQAILLLCSHWFENRQVMTDARMMPMPFGVESLVGMRRKGWVGA